MTAVAARFRGGAGRERWTTPVLHPVVRDVTERIRVRSAETRRRYLERIGGAARRRPARLDLGCANLAHGFAACESSAKDDLRGNVKVNVAIVSSYNDMLSAGRGGQRPVRVRGLRRSVRRRRPLHGA